MHNQITPVILTYNEEPNIERCLDALTWAKKIIVVDSYSTDKTESICRNYDNVEFLQNQFVSFADQRNFALKHVEGEWVLSLDADHILSKDLIEELYLIKPNTSINGYYLSYIYKIDGKPLSASLYPPLVALFRKDKLHYVQDGHAQKAELQGISEHLLAKAYHDDRKPMTRWLQSQWTYAEQEVEKLNSAKWSDLAVQDKLRKIPFLAPLIVLPYTLLIKRTILDGRAGLLYTAQRFLAEIILQYALIRNKSLKTN
jgi:glycosyltransferase involved in cell wall biosynthesis